MKTRTQKSHHQSQAGLQSHPEKSIVTDNQPSATVAQEPKWRGVYFDGPDSDRDSEGEEVPVYHVYVGDQDGEPTGTVYHVHSFKTAENLARRMASDRRLDLITDAMPA